MTMTMNGTMAMVMININDVYYRNRYNDEGDDGND